MQQPIERPSLKTDMVNRYNGSNKNIDMPANNFVDTANQYSKNFTKFAQPMFTELTDKAQNYSDAIGVSTQKYSSR